MASRKGEIAQELDALWPLRQEDSDAEKTDKFRYRARRKVERLAERHGVTTVKVGQRVVRVSDVHVDDKGQLVCHIDGPNLPKFEADGTPWRWEWVNPPIMVPDGTTSVDPEGNQVDNFVEDVDGAFSQIVADAVERAWRP